MGAERRKHERRSCLIPCDVELYGTTVEGNVRDISAGGLSVQANLPVSQGDVLNITLNLDRRRKIELQGIVWHDRRRKKKAGDSVQRIGLVLSDAPDAFRELLPSSKSITPVSEPVVVEEPEVAEPRVLPKEPDPAEDKRFKVRVKQDTNPRTRSIIVFAENEDQAREFARAETGEGWHILEVDRA